MRKIKMTKLVDNIGKILLDIGKLTLASFVIGGIVKGDVSTLFLLGMGAAVSAVLMAAGVLFSSLEE